MDSSSKVVLVGDAGVGKTSFLRMVRDREYKTHAPTEGADVTEIRAEGKRLEVWDCGGRYMGLKEGYWIGAKVAVVMFSIDSVQSWVSVKKWIDEVQAVCGNVPVIIVGTKADRSTVQVDKGMVARGLFALRKNHKTLRYTECSAKIGYGCDSVIELVAKYLP